MSADRRNGGGRKAKPIAEIPFALIEDQWQPSPLDPFITRDGDDYVINVLAFVSLVPAEIRVDSFRVASDGTVLSAPRGYAREYKPGRITGMDEAVARYAAEATK
jgi:hypothetical protein